MRGDEKDAQGNPRGDVENAVNKIYELHKDLPTESNLKIHGFYMFSPKKLPGYLSFLAGHMGGVPRQIHYGCNSKCTLSVC